jgi:hypothetical protein
VSAVVGPVRRTRQASITRTTGPASLQVVLNEAVLRRAAGGENVPANLDNVT